MATLVERMNYNRCQKLLRGLRLPAPTQVWVQKVAMFCTGTTPPCQSPPPPPPVGHLKLRSNLWPKRFLSTHVVVKVPQGRTYLRLNLSILWAFIAALTSLSKSPQGRTCLRLNLSILWAYGGTNLAFKVLPRQDMLEVELEHFVGLLR